ncbi:MAG: hypothetical protein ACP5VF_13260 [Acidobacteriota bacterium]
MSGALTLESMSPGLLKVAERARREPGGRFHSLAHLMDEAALERALLGDFPERFEVAGRPMENLPDVFRIPAWRAPTADPPATGTSS